MRKNSVQARYKGKPAAEAAFYKGVDCQKHWFSLAHAHKEASHVVKNSNDEAAHLFREYVKSGGVFEGNIHPDRTGEHGENFLCNAWHHGSDGNHLSNSFQCPWDVGQLNDLGNRDDIVTMVRYLVQAWYQSLGFNGDSQKSFADTIIEGSVASDGDFTPNWHDEIPDYSNSTKLIKDGIVAFVYVTKRDPSFVKLNDPAWVHSLVRECCGVSSAYNVTVQFHKIQKLDSGKYEITRERLQYLEFQTMFSQDPSMFLENSLTTCKVLSQSGEGPTPAADEAPFQYRQSNAALVYPFHPFQESDLLLRACALQMGATKMFLMQGSDAWHADGGGDPPNLAIANVKSCRYRSLYSREATHVIVTSVINAVGDGSLGNKAATLKLRTVYCISRKIPNSDHHYDDNPSTVQIPKSPSPNIFTFAPLSMSPAVKLGSKKPGSASFSGGAAGFSGVKDSSNQQLSRAASGNSKKAAGFSGVKNSSNQQLGRAGCKGGKNAGNSTKAAFLTQRTGGGGMFLGAPHDDTIVSTIEDEDDDGREMGAAAVNSAYSRSRRKAPAAVNGQSIRFMESSSPSYEEIQDAWQQNAKKAARAWKQRLGAFMRNAGNPIRSAVYEERKRKINAKVGGAGTGKMENAMETDIPGKKDEDAMDIDSPNVQVLSPGRRRVYAPGSNVDMEDVSNAAKTKSKLTVVLEPGVLGNNNNALTGSPFGSSLPKTIGDVDAKSTAAAAGAVAFRKGCMTVDESKHVLRQHGLLGQANAVLSAAVFGS